ncbi:MAG: tRNA1(Val) (adenine(37)-N6)-methyltransferase [Acutalibacteraceae bacterium]|nr:tRNA1(Val) (adenine(37)-N6)-methyltransferase [Acutalibacteraceae bacterium]
MIKLLNDEKIEPLGNNMKIIVSDSHTFGTDAILLASFANIKRKDRACDMGTGCGIIPLIWCKGYTNSVTAIDIQPKAISQLEKSISLNEIEGRIEPLNCDLRSLKGNIEFGSFDLVTMNPPYKPVGTGIESISEAERIARHEVMCTIDDAVSAAAKLLKFGGRFCMCHRPERLCDIIVSMRNGGIEVKRVRFVCEKEGKAPWLLLVEGKRGSKSSVTVEKNLIMHNSDGTPTDEFRAMFGDYMDGHQ